MLNERKNNNRGRWKAVADALINNPVLEFLVERYVNWSTESQRLFRRFAGLFVLAVVLLGVLLIYMTTMDYHYKMRQHHTIYQAIRKYATRKAQQDRQFEILQSGRGGIVQGFDAGRINNIMRQHNIATDVFSVRAMEPVREGVLEHKSFEVRVKSLTYPQLVNTIFELESIGRNIHLETLKITQEDQERGFYTMMFKVVTAEPVIEPPAR